MEAAQFSTHYLVSKSIYFAFISFIFEIRQQSYGRTLN